MLVAPKILAWLGFAIAASYLLWLCYISVMSLRTQRNANRMTLLDKVFGYPTLVVGYALDMVVNAVILSIVLLELPDELVVTTRAKRWATSWRDNPETGLNGWRQAVCVWLLRQITHHDPSGEHSISGVTD
jgi:hypothetical protein